MALLHEYSEFAVLLARRQGTPEAIHHAKRAVLDWLASLYPGTDCPSARYLVEAFGDELGVGHSSVVGRGKRAFPSTAAWINGTASHAVEYDDTFREAVYHPGAPTIAAALAVAEARDVRGKEFLTAIVAGYEISTRIGAALQPSHVPHFHATGTVGCIGAAASAAVLYSPTDAVAVRHALATAATFASGLQQALRSESMTKPLHAGHAASVGVRAAQAAAHGVTGAADILEGPVGMGAVMADGARWDAATRDLGEVYNITRITHKVHACCGHQFPAIDAALALRSLHGIDPESIATVHIATYQEAIDATGRFDPKTPYEAKFSLPYVVSHAIVNGAVGLDAFEPERVGSPALRSLMRLCTLEGDPVLSAGFPSQRAARVTITTKAGIQLTHFAPHRRGDPEWPLSDEDLNAKFEDLCAPVIGLARTKQLRNQVWRLDEISVRELELAGR
jgi:2-methylcitrate dehydratase PrpD